MLTANLKKCAIAQKEVQYLGYHLGSRQVCQQTRKTNAIVFCSCPRTKKEVREF